MRRSLFLSPVARIRAARATQVALWLALVAVSPATATGLSRIAFSSTRAGGGNPLIYLVNPDGSSVTRVSPNAYGGDSPALSPDGTKIVFESPRRFYGQLYVVGADGSSEHRLVIPDFYGQSGAWSPDGGRIAFSHSSNNGQPGGTGSTWVIHADGTGLTQLSPPGVDDWYPDWSPDGTRFAFTSFVDGRGEIFLMDTDGSDRLRITDAPGDKYGPQWSPDGSKLAYTLLPDPSVALASVHVMNADGSGDHAVTDTSSLNGAPAWSPDGSRIALHSNRSGCFQIYTIAADGTDLQRVTWVASTPGDWCGSWRDVTVGAAVTEPAGAASFALRVPSPASGRATIRFTLPRDGATSLEVFDSTGRRVRTLLRRQSGAGAHSVLWDGSDDAGRGCPAGVYHCRLASGAASRTAKLVFVR
jgi:TolB protein